MQKDVLTISTAQRMLGAFNLLMMLPENHVLFIGSGGCARHSFELGLLKYHQRVSFLTLTDRELICGDLEGVISKAIGEILKKAKPKPKVITLHSGCQMRFLAVDFGAMQDNLEKEHGIPIGHFTMNRMLGSASNRVFPDLFKSHFSFLRQQTAAPTVNLLGSIAYLEPENEIETCLAQGGLKEVLTLKDREDFSAFQKMAGSRLNIILHQDYFDAALDMENRLGIPWIYLPIVYDPEEVMEQYENLSAILDFEIDLEACREKTLKIIEETLLLVKETPLLFNLIGIHKPFSMIRALVKMGFNVVGFNHVPYAAYEDEAEKAALNWLEKCTKANTSRNDRLEHQGAFGSEQLENRRFEGAYVGFAAINNLMNLIKGAYLGDEQIVAATNSILF